VPLHPKTTFCKSSIAEALLKKNGGIRVSPIKKQCYFIPYGEKLECSVLC
jgi:recombination protein RecT